MASESHKLVLAALREVQAAQEKLIAVQGKLEKVLKGADLLMLPVEGGVEIKIMGDLPLIDGTSFEVTEQYFNELAGLYLGVDVDEQFRIIKAWLLANPTRRKTRKGIQRFITNWLTRAQDRSRGK